MYSNKIDCLLKAENIKKLKAEDIVNLCELISVDKLRNCVVDYRKDPSTKKKRYGKDSKEWKSVNNDKPESGFICNFFVDKLLKEDPIDDLVLNALNEKYLKTILGKTDYKNPTIEKIIQAIDNNEKYKTYDQILLKKVIGEDVADEEFEKAKSESAKPKENIVSLKMIRKKTVDIDSPDDSEKVKKLKAENEELENKITTLKNEKKKLQSDLNDANEELKDLRKTLKDNESLYSECRKNYEELKKKLDLIMKKEKVHIDYENGDFDKANLEKLQKAIDDGFKAKDYKALQKIMVKTYVILGIFDGGQKK